MAMIQKNDAVKVTCAKDSALYRLVSIRGFNPMTGKVNCVLRSGAGLLRKNNVKLKKFKQR